ncbi:MAG TPA: hypothetical protein VJO35_07430 [Terriglobales bacterium]|nr:hypothetical protein [Terriglobales bacterium]
MDDLGLVKTPTLFPSRRDPNFGSDWDIRFRKTRRQSNRSGSAIGSGRDFNGVDLGIQNPSLRCTQLNSVTELYALPDPQI